MLSHAHGLAAAQATGGLAPVQVPQAVALQVYLQLFADIPALAYGVKILGLDAALLDTRQRCDQRAGLGQVGNRGALPDYLLVQQVNTAKASTMAAARFALAGQNLPEQALAHTIAPDQASAAVVKGFVKVGKQLPAIRQGQGDAVQRQD